MFERVPGQTRVRRKRSASFHPRPVAQVNPASGFFTETRSGSNPSGLVERLIRRINRAELIRQHRTVARAAEFSMDKPRIVHLFSAHGSARNEAHFARQSRRRCGARHPVFRRHLFAGFRACAVNRQEDDRPLGRALRRVHDGRILAGGADVSRGVAEATRGSAPLTRPQRGERRDGLLRTVLSRLLRHWLNTGVASRV
jgi:hypothetical protein